MSRTSNAIVGQVPSLPESGVQGRRAESMNNEQRSANGPWARERLVDFGRTCGTIRDEKVGAGSRFSVVEVRTSRRQERVETVMESPAATVPRTVDSRLSRSRFGQFAAPWMMSSSCLNPASEFSETGRRQRRSSPGIMSSDGGFERSFRHSSGRSRRGLLASVFARRSSPAARRRADWRKPRRFPRSIFVNSSTANAICGSRRSIGSPKFSDSV